MTEQKNTSTESLQRIEFGHQSVQERIKHFGDFTIALTDDEIHRAVSALFALRHAVLLGKLSVAQPSCGLQSTGS